MRKVILLAIGLTLTSPDRMTASEQQLDAMSREYLETVEEVAGCAAAVSMATGDTAFLEEYDLIDGHKMFYNKLADGGRAYELAFELGDEFDAPALRQQLIQLRTVLSSMRVFEARAGMPEPHRKLVSKKRAEAFAFNAGFYAAGDIRALGDQLTQCRDLYLTLGDALS